jgi:hypothetical protein
MPRFEPELNTPDADAGPVAAAAGELRTSLNRQIAELIDAAGVKAACIEAEARARGQQHELEVRQREREFALEQSGRITRLLGALEALEAALDGVAQELRSELASIAEDGHGDSAEEPTAPSAEVFHSAEPASDIDADFDDDFAPEPYDDAEEVSSGPLDSPVPLSLIAHSTQEDSAQLDTLVREQIQAMSRDGVPREEAERILSSLGRGERYAQLLDETYSSPRDGAPKGRRWLRRRQP